MSFLLIFSLIVSFQLRLKNKGKFGQLPFHGSLLIHDWKPRYWSNTENQRNFMDLIAKKLSITEYDGWKHVTKTVIERNGGAGLVRRYNGSMTKLLETVYPEHQWDQMKTIRKGKPFSKTQQLLRQQVQKVKNKSLQIFIRFCEAKVCFGFTKTNETYLLFLPDHFFKILPSEQIDFNVRCTVGEKKSVELDVSSINTIKHTLLP